MIKAVLFDVIGTTVLEKGPSPIINGLKLAFQEYNVEPLEEVIRANRGKDKVEMINQILKETNASLDLSGPIFDAFIRNINQSFDAFEAAPQIEQTFESLKVMGVKVGLGTGLPKHQLLGILEHLGWQELTFDYVKTAEEIGETRPHPAMILDMMKKMGIDEKKCFLKVGDTLADIQEGKNAGVLTASVTSGTQNTASLSSAKPDFIVSKAADILEIVEKT